MIWWSEPTGSSRQTRDMIFPGARQTALHGPGYLPAYWRSGPEGMDRTYFFMGGGLQGGASTRYRQRTCICTCCTPAPSNPWIDVKDQPQRLYEAMEGFGGFIPQIRETVRTTNAHSVNYRPLEVLLQPAPWYRGHVVLIGDAAHSTTPHLASGAGMAIEDGIVLTEEIQSQPTLTAALEKFMTRRFERCRLVIENSVKNSVTSK